MGRLRYAHGISNRLTGGPDNTNCLGSGQAGGMGEGWGDFLSVVFRCVLGAAWRPRNRADA